MSSTLAIPASAANAPPRFSLALPPNIARKQSVSSNQSPAQPAAALPAASSVSVPAPIAAAAGASASGQNAQAGPSTLNRRGSAVAAGGRARSASPAAEEDDDGSDADDDDEGGGGGGAGGGATKKKGGAKKGKKAGDAGAGAQAKEYKYTSEISQMVSFPQARSGPGDMFMDADETLGTDVCVWRSARSITRDCATGGGCRTRTDYRDCQCPKTRL